MKIGLIDVDSKTSPTWRWKKSKPMKPKGAKNNDGN